LTLKAYGSCVLTLELHVRVHSLTAAQAPAGAGSGLPTGNGAGVIDDDASKPIALDGASSDSSAAHSSQFSTGPSSGTKSHRKTQSMFKFSREFAPAELKHR